MKKAISILLLIFSSSAVYSIVPLDTNWRNVFQWYIQPPPLVADIDSSGLIIGGSRYYGTIYPLSGYKFDTLNWIAKWNGEDWVPFVDSLGFSGLSPYDEINFPFSIKVTTILSAENKIFVGGFFDSAGSTPCNGIAYWNGSKWNCVGGGTSKYGIVNSMTYINGNLYVTGAFDSIGGIRANGIARWDGNNWYPLGAGLFAKFGEDISSGTGTAITHDPYGRIYVAGYFDSVDNIRAKQIAYWDGTQWYALERNPFSNAQETQTINSMLFIEGNLYVCGYFTVMEDTTTINAIAVWNRNTWFPLSTNLKGWCNKVKTDGNNLYFGGLFTITTRDSFEIRNIAKFNGEELIPFGSGTNEEVNDIVIYEKDGTQIVFVVGYFDKVGDTLQSPHMAIWSERPVPLPIFSSANSDNNNTLNNSILAYPNPSLDYLWLSIPNTITGNTALIKIFDLYGNTLISEKFSGQSNKIKINISNLPLGIYQVVVSNSNTVLATKFVKYIR